MSMRIIVTALMAILCWLPSSFSQEAQRVSLLTGVGHYPADAGWRPTSASNDIDILHAAMKSLGFSVETLINEAATYENLVSALQNAAVHVRPAGIFHFHFSGHGQQIADINGDEFDGLDEALVPYDARRDYVPGQYEGERHLSDDELGSLLHNIRRAIGPDGQVFVSLDACHSGTATRGQATVRGTHLLFTETGQELGATRSPKPAREVVMEENLAPMVVFFATSPHELNWEVLAPDGKRYGPLSYAMAVVFLNPSGKEATYKGVFDRIRAQMAVLSPRQTPSAEGALDRLLWSIGSANKKFTHYEVRLVGNEREVQINGGLLQSLHPGSRLAFYTPDTFGEQGNRPFVTGTLVHSELVHAYVELDSSAPGRKLAEAWVYVTEYAASEQLVYVKVDLAQDSALAHTLQQQLAQLPFVGLEEDRATLWVQMNESNELELWSHREELLCRLPRSRSQFSDAAYLTERIRLYAQAQHLRRLEHEDHWLQARFELLPLDEERCSKEGIWRMPEGTRFYIDVENTGTKACYIQLLNVQANNEVVCLIPTGSGQLTPLDYRIEPGERRRLKAGNGTDHWIAGGPPGIDVLKLLLTEEPADLRPVLRGQTAPGTEAPWSRWLQLPARRGEPVLLPGGSAGLLTAVLEVY